jgi:hypothetical protein
MVVYRGNNDMNYPQCHTASKENISCSHYKMDAFKWFIFLQVLQHNGIKNNHYQYPNHRERCAIQEIEPEIGNRKGNV